MRRRKTAGAMLMCATFMLVAAAPLVQSAEDVHEIVKTENGPPSTCALTWDFFAPSDGFWCAHVENHGMRWIIFDMIDTNTNDVVIDRDMYRYAVYTDVFDTPQVDVVGGHTYQITGTPNGPLGTSVTVTDVFEPIAEPEPPVASFTVSVDGLTVSVDASASYDPDGTIVDYDWDFGDGST
ncbi:MAG: PKD domain-containing protein, partial [Methanobacteriota archaeon]